MGPPARTTNRYRSNESTLQLEQHLTKILHVVLLVLGKEVVTCRRRDTPYPASTQRQKLDQRIDTDVGQLAFRLDQFKPIGRGRLFPRCAQFGRPGISLGKAEIEMDRREITQFVRLQQCLHTM